MRYAYAVELIALAVLGRERKPTTARLRRLAPHLGAKEIAHLLTAATDERSVYFAAPPLLAHGGYQVLRLSGDGRGTVLEWAGLGWLDDPGDEAPPLYRLRAVLHARAGWGRFLGDGVPEWEPLRAGKLPLDRTSAHHAACPPIRNRIDVAGLETFSQPLAWLSPPRSHRHP